MLIECLLCTIVKAICNLEEYQSQFPILKTERHKKDS